MLDKHERFALLCLGIIVAAWLFFPLTARAQDPIGNCVRHVGGAGPSPAQMTYAACGAWMAANVHPSWGIGANPSNDWVSFPANPPTHYGGYRLPISPGHTTNAASWTMYTEPTSNSCELPHEQQRYELITDAPILNYSPEEFICFENCRFDYVETYFFDNGDMEHTYSNSAGLCDNEWPEPETPFPTEPTQPDPEEDCYNVIGWVDGQPVCGDKADECKATGGQFGYVNGQEVCIPKEEEPPTCPPRTVLTASVGGGHECVPIDTDPPPDPEEPPPCEDTADIDCDGTPNEEDPDSDGDGRPDGPHPYEGDGTCDPTHPGYATCIGNLQSVSDNLDDKLKADARLEASSAGDRIFNSVKGSLGNGESGIGAPEGLGTAVADILGFESLACADVSFPIVGHNLEFTCGQTEPIRILLGFAFSVLTIISIFNLATQRSAD